MLFYGLHTVITPLHIHEAKSHHNPFTVPVTLDYVFGLSVLKHNALLPTPVFYGNVEVMPSSPFVQCSVLGVLHDHRILLTFNTGQKGVIYFEIVRNPCVTLISVQRGSSTSQ